MVIDIIVIAALLVSAIIAYLRGFIREVLTIIGVAGGLAAAVYGAPYLKPVYRGWLGVHETKDPSKPVEKLFDIVPYSTVADVLAYATIFILVVIVLSLLSHWLSGAAKEHGLGPIDRTLGVLFGFVRGVLLLALLYLPVHLLADKDTKARWFKDSKTHFYIEWTSKELAAMLPDSLDQNLKEAREGQAGAKDALLQGTRERLQELDVLHQGAASPKETGPAAGERNDPNSPGYKPEERKKLDTLFEEQKKYND